MPVSTVCSSGRETVAEAYPVDARRDPYGRTCSGPVRVVLRALVGLDAVPAQDPARPSRERPAQGGHGSECCDDGEGVRPNRYR
jgi:hypothetical protein